MIRYSAALFALFAACTTVLAAGSAVKDQILDVRVEPQYEFGLGFVPESDIDGFGSTALFEPYGDWSFAYFHQILKGDIDLNLRYHSTVFTSDGDINLPYQVVKLAIDAGWTWRFEGNSAMQIRVKPGIYSDFTEFNTESFYMPFSMALIHTFDPKVSGMVGFEIRPDFRRQIMPVIGFAWEVSDALRIDARLPESKIIIYPVQNFNIYAGFSWDSLSYHLNEGDSPTDRHQLTMEDFRLYGGATLKVSPNMEINAEYGTVFNRTIQFGGASDNDAIDIARQNLFKIGIACPL